MRRSIDDLQVGDRYVEDVVFTPEWTNRFLELSRDRSSVHVDADSAREQGYERLLVHGFLLGLAFSRILGMELPGEDAVIGSIDLKFHDAVYVGETVTYTTTVRRVLKPLATVALDLEARKADGTVCVAGGSTCVFRR